METKEYIKQFKNGALSNFENKLLDLISSLEERINKLENKE